MATNPFDSVVSRLVVTRAGGSGMMARCPAHDDRQASLSVSRGDDGRVLLFCHAGCSTVDVVEALGLRMSDLFPEQQQQREGQRRRVDAVYDYVDEHGELLFQVVRYMPKGFAQRRPDGGGRWVWNLTGVRRVLFRLPRVVAAAAAAGDVWVVEGEKDVLALEAVGVVATTNPGGAGKWSDAYTEVLVGCSLVSVVADDDTAGRAHAEVVRRSLEARGVPCRVLLPAAGAKDVAEHLGRNLGLDDLVPFVEDTPPVVERPTVVVNRSGLEDVTASTIEALVHANNPPTLFVRSSQVVRVTCVDGTPVVSLMTPVSMRHEMALAATFVRAARDSLTVVFPPQDVAANVLASRNLPFPQLRGVVEAPVVRRDGTLHTRFGYDPVSGLWCAYRGQVDVPDDPTGGQVAAAVALLDDVFGDFPFEGEADRANTLALLLTGLLREMVDAPAPLVVIDAPEPGTGKSLLLRVVMQVVTGRSSGVTTMPRDDEELRKQVTSALLRGATFIAYDNVDHVVRSATLAAALTSDTWTDRLLGRSEDVTVANRATWAVTGNNISVGGDLARRCYRVRLDARQAQPWRRTGFRHPDLEGWVAEHRDDVLSALLTLIRNWCSTGRPTPGGLPVVGGFGRWVSTVGGVLAAAGINGFLGNMDVFMASADREAQQWEAFLCAWWDTLGDRVVSVSDLLRMMEASDSVLRDTLPEDLASAYDTGRGFRTKLGQALTRRVNRHHGERGWKLVAAPMDRRKVQLFAVTATNPPAVDCSDGWVDDYF